MKMNRPGFTLVQRQGVLTLEIYGRQSTSAPRFTSYSQSSAGVAVVLGRLFYRQDLLDRLGPAAPANHRLACRQDERLSDVANDAALVMAAYERWGREALTRLEGDFAVAIYDARDRCLIGLRDTLGGYPLYYISSPEAAAVGTCLGPLTRLRPGAVVSRDGLANYLLLRTFGFQQPDGDASIFEGVGRVRVGQVVRLDPGSGRVERSNYWDWAGAATAADIPGDHPEAIHEQFAGLLREAVRERCTDTTAAQLSGGMDSTSVALLAAELLAGRGPVHAVSLVYERWSRLAHETPFIREALDAHTALVSHLLPADDIDDFARFPTPPPPDEPWPGLYRVATEAAMYDAAAAVGAGSMLTGAGGDEIADPLPFDVADRLRGGQPWAAGRAAARWAAGHNRNVWHVFRPYGLMPLTPAPLRGGLGTFLRHGRARWRALDDYWIPPWVRPDFARKHDLYDRVLGELRRARSFDPSLQVSESLYMIVARNGDMIRWYLGAPRGIHTGNPFLDPRVFRYGLAVRTRLPFLPDRQKPLLADAMRGGLPDVIRHRRRKGNFSEAYFLGLSRRANYLEAMIENAPVDDLAFLDKGVLLRCFREYRMARASNVPAGGRMTTILAVLNWLSHHQDWLRALSPASQTLQWPLDDPRCALQLSRKECLGGRE
jgi:asparagine synthase (glutamine-hydrolysing)